MGFAFSKMKGEDDHTCTYFDREFFQSLQLVFPKRSVLPDKFYFRSVLISDILNHLFKLNFVVCDKSQSVVINLIKLQNFWVEINFNSNFLISWSCIHMSSSTLKFTGLINKLFVLFGGCFHLEIILTTAKIFMLLKNPCPCGFYSPETEKF